MKKIISVLILIIVLQIQAFGFNQNIYNYSEVETSVYDKLKSNKCKGYDESDVPTIFIPGILASWYSEQGFKDTDTYLRKTSG